MSPNDIGELTFIFLPVCLDLRPFVCLASYFNLRPFIWLISHQVYLPIRLPVSYHVMFSLDLRPFVFFIITFMSYLYLCLCLRPFHPVLRIGVSICLSVPAVGPCRFLLSVAVVGSCYRSLSSVLAGSCCRFLLSVPVSVPVVGSCCRFLLSVHVVGRSFGCDVSTLFVLSLLFLSANEAWLKPTADDRRRLWWRCHIFYVLWNRMNLILIYSTEVWSMKPEIPCALWGKKVW